MSEANLNYYEGIIQPEPQITPKMIYIKCPIYKESRGKREVRPIGLQAGIIRRRLYGNCDNTHENYTKVESFGRKLETMR